MNVIAGNVVHEVTENGPAWRAGIGEGDILLRVHFNAVELLKGERGDPWTEAMIAHIQKVGVNKVVAIRVLKFVRLSGIQKSRKASFSTRRTLLRNGVPGDFNHYVAKFDRRHYKIRTSQLGDSTTAIGNGGTVQYEDEDDTDEAYTDTEQEQPRAGKHYLLRSRPANSVVTFESSHTEEDYSDSDDDQEDDDESLYENGSPAPNLDHNLSVTSDDECDSLLEIVLCGSSDKNGAESSDNENDAHEQEGSRAVRIHPGNESPGHVLVGIHDSENSSVAGEGSPSIGSKRSRDLELEEQAQKRHQVGLRRIWADACAAFQQSDEFPDQFLTVIEYAKEQSAGDADSDENDDCPRALAGPIARLFDQPSPWSPAVDRDDDQAIKYKALEKLRERWTKAERFVIAYADDQGLIHQDSNPLVANDERIEEISDNDDQANNSTLLMYASEIGHVQDVDHLLSLGADVSAVNADGQNALMLASCGGHLDVVSALLDHNRDGVNSTDSDGWTALMIATECEQFEVMQKLVENGAAIHPRNNDGLNANDIAERTGNQVSINFFHHEIRAQHMEIIKAHTAKMVESSKLVDHLFSNFAFYDEYRDISETG